VGERRVCRQRGWGGQYRGPAADDPGRYTLDRPLAVGDVVYAIGYRFPPGL
jgi:hypothetical protein